MRNYKTVRVNGKKVDEHRYLVEKSLGRKLNRKEVVHHIDSNIRNNALSNLKVMSLSEHSALHSKEILKNDSFRESLKKRNHYAALSAYKRNVLNMDQVREIKRLKGALTQVEIAKKYNVSRCTINRIHSERMWAHVKI